MTIYCILKLLFLCAKKIVRINFLVHNVYIFRQFRHQKSLCKNEIRKKRTSLHHEHNQLYSRSMYVHFCLRHFIIQNNGNFCFLWLQSNLTPKRPSVVYLQYIFPSSTQSCKIPLVNKIILKLSADNSSISALLNKGRSTDIHEICISVLLQFYSIGPASALPLYSYLQHRKDKLPLCRPQDCRQC